MMRLSVYPSCDVTIIAEDGVSVVQRSVESCIGPQLVYDWFGNKKKINIINPKIEETRFLVTCGSGETSSFGESHSFLSKDGQGLWKRKLLKDITEIHFAKLPQKKTLPPVGLFEHFDIDDEGMFIEVEDTRDFRSMMKRAAYSGITVNRRKSQQRIDLDKGKAACFATKLLNGSFQQNFNTTVGSLLGGGVVSSSEILTNTRRKFLRDAGVLFEGASIFNEIIVIPPRVMDQKIPVCYIELEDDYTPVELDWFCS
jgi:hypothetical protein